MQLNKDGRSKSPLDFTFSKSANILELRQYKNGLAYVKNMFVLKLPPFPSPTRQGKKRGNFKTSMPFT